MTNYSAVAVLSTLADPTRRAIFEKLAAAPQAVGKLAEGLPVSRPAVSQHLKVLKDAGLVSETAQGTRRVYRIDPRGIGMMRDWLDRFWQQAMDDFAVYAEQLAKEEKE
jgi:DNA-binding transcriptional ArsR family regulator